VLDAEPAAPDDRDGPDPGGGPGGRRRQIHELRSRAAGHRHLLTGSAVLAIGSAVHAVSGALFWLVAARSDAQTDVGHATALFTSTLFVAFVAGLGLPVAVARYAAGRGRDDHVLFAWSALATSMAAAVAAAAYVALVSAGAVEELRAWRGAAGPALFVALTVGTALSVLVDVRLMTQRRWGLVLVRITLAGLGRFPLLALPVDGDRAIWLLVAVSLPTALSGLVVVGALPRITAGHHRLAPVPRSWRPMARYSVLNWLAQLTYQAPAFALPVIVLVNVDADTNASFYVAWGVANLAAYLPASIGQALLAEGGRDGARIRSQVRLALVVAVGLMAAGAAVAALGSEVIVSLYGEDYREAARVMPWLVLGAVPWAVTSVYLTEARVQHRGRATIAITSVLSVAILGPALMLVPGRGLDGAVVAYLGGNVAAAIVAGVAHVRGRGRPAAGLVPTATPADALAPDAGVALPQR
jgi:O-antigen/teichoic acid export membrane protein